MEAKIPGAVALVEIDLSTDKATDGPLLDVRYEPAEGNLETLSVR